MERVISKCLKKRDERIKLDELISLFVRRTAVNTPKRSNSAGSLMKNIKMPRNTKDVSALLPSSRYAKKDLRLNPEDTDKPSDYSKVLDRFLKEKGPSLNKQRKLNNNAYTY